MKLVSVIFILLAPLLAQSVHPRDCNDVGSSGGGNTDTIISRVYDIFPFGSTPAVPVHCASNRYTVIMKRANGVVLFNRNFDEYEDGFGDAAGEYFIGLDILSHLTKNQSYELLIRLVDASSGVPLTAHYSSFSVGAQAANYPLIVSGFTGGEAGDIMADHNGQVFSTIDQDNSFNNCAQMMQTGFWFGSCPSGNHDRLYITNAQSNQYAVGVERKNMAQNLHLNSFVMMIRRTNA